MASARPVYLSFFEDKCREITTVAGTLSVSTEPVGQPRSVVEVEYYPFFYNGLSDEEPITHGQDSGLARSLRLRSAVMRKMFSIRLERSRAIRMALIVVVAAGSSLLLASCGDDDPVVIDKIIIDNGPPSAPDGVFSITGDGQVEICWNPNPENDIAGYDIYWNDEPTGFFEYVATVDANTTCYIDTDVKNGDTYFYAVLAFDEDGLESELSYEDVFDTPRPEGTNLVLFNYLGPNSSLSGYDFSSLSGIAQAWDNPTTDVYFGSPNGVPTLFADQGAGVDVQDYGYIELLYVDWAPLEGWAPSGRVELIEGHSYIVIIDQGGHYNMAKFYVVAASPTSVTLDWAYQIDDNNPELAPGIGGAQR